MRTAAAATAAQAKPDLTVAKVVLTRDQGGIFVDKVTVTVANGCANTVAGASYILITFKDGAQKDAKATYFVGNTVKPLRGGESQTQTFDISQQKIVFGRYVFVEADPYKKVAEASEDNNWRTLFPDGAGTVLNQAQCAP